ncbi:MAG: hypothetical protein PHF33_06250 [Candidatus Delongbacteria bacterium]|jgi:hypothetical protein|nr:hypothetical protein [Candidatus Delongbacteria bacterium]MDD4205070.1 hypothetical protein [Candidatus Delongbacteria bacterium]MDY0017978.1 hypothetical protein [Candidatus Delongbacteria bacterium]
MKIILLILLPITSYAGIFFISEADINSRTTGLRSSDFAVVSYAPNIVSNPSFLAGQESIYLVSSYHRHFTEVNSGSITFSHPNLIYKKIPLAVSISTISYGEFVSIDTGSNYSPYETMLVLSSAYKYKEVLFGVNLKYLYSSINNEYSSSGLIFDLASSYKLFSDKLFLSAGIFNTGFQIDEYYDENESVEGFIKTGVGYRLDKLPLTLMIQNDLYFVGRTRTAAGVEFNAKENLTVRAGYELSIRDMNIGTATKNEQFSGLSLGATILFMDFGFDFSYLINGEMDNEFSMTMNLNLNKYLK